MAGQREILAAYGGVKIDDIRHGVRYWPLIGQYWSSDLNTGLWLVKLSDFGLCVYFLTLRIFLLLRWNDSDWSLLDHKMIVYLTDNSKKYPYIFWLNIARIVREKILLATKILDKNIDNRFKALIQSVHIRRVCTMKIWATSECSQIVSKYVWIAES